MSKPIIEVDNLSKLYHLGLIGATTLHESLERWWLKARGKEEAARSIGAKHLMISPDDPQAGPEPNTIWALKGISFTVQAGDILGIIGRNGAGKSTLLKILSRITEPTSGRAVIRGRTSSLLEVGTGFHPELTGRENVYLNGVILGMRKSEIARKFDEIVAFAEIEKFIDTPVKRYSSGMYVRLAFAVAAHLEPEILLVDEVLAVGDAAFQKKCLGKMGDVAKEGRTVLFVSHNMGAIRVLCEKGIWLSNGIIQNYSVIDKIVDGYLQMFEQNSLEDLRNRKDRQGTGKARVINLELYSDGRPAKKLVMGRRASFVFYVDGIADKMNCAFAIYDRMGQPLLFFTSAGCDKNCPEGISEGEKFVCEIEEVLLLPGAYRINVGLSIDGETLDHIEAAAFFDVEEGPIRGRCLPHYDRRTSIWMHHNWKIPRSS